MKAKKLTPERRLLLAWDERNAPTATEVRELFFDLALADWWNRACWSERYELMHGFGFNVDRARQLAGWCWSNIPRQARSFVTKQALDGRPMEYLAMRDAWR